jgi:hypothetical protein
MSNGGSQPRVCDFDDMVLRLVKWHPSNGLTSTYSELAASRLGQLIDSPVVRGSVVFVDMGLLPPEFQGRIMQPYHIGFTYAPGQNFSEADYGGIKNTTALPAAVVHLAWLQVGDQETHNQYLYQLEHVLPDRTIRKMNHFILVDLACICGCHDWSQVALNSPNGSYNLPPHLKSRVQMPAVEPLLQRVGAIPEEAIRSCFDSHPEEWGIGDDLVRKVTDYIVERRKYLADILKASLT